MLFRTAATALALAVSAPAAQAATSAFSYDPDADNGPENWAGLDLGPDTDNQCGGTENSPLALTDTGCTHYRDYILRAGSCTAEDTVFTINDHGVKAEFKAGSCEFPTLEMPEVDGVFDAVQFHIHTGSEHTVDGVTFAAELHIVHARRNCPKTAERCFAVVGTKLNPASNSDNDLFRFFLDGWVKVHNEQETKCGNTGNIIDYEAVTLPTTLIDPYQFNRNSRFFHYEGGLTTPPCSEVVLWNLDDAALAISPEQYAHLGRIILDFKGSDCKRATVAHDGSTSRPTQPINGRTIIKNCPKNYEPDDATREDEEDDSSAAAVGTVVSALGAAANAVGQMF